MSTQFPTGETGDSAAPGAAGGPPPPRGPRGSQPLRAVVVVVVAVAVAVLVLARMSTPHSTAAPTTSAGTTATTSQQAASTSTSGTTSTTVATSSTTTTTVAPSSVTILVLNGWTTPHGALYFQKKLASHGYDTLAPNNAAADTVRLSKIYITNGTPKSTNAYQVAGIVGVGPAAVVYPSPANAPAVPPSLLHVSDLVVLVGADISGQVPPGYNG